MKNTGTLNNTYLLHQSAISIFMMRIKNICERKADVLNQECVKSRCIKSGNCGFGHTC